MITNLKNSGRPVGASTITQQVAKNLLVGNEVSYVRKRKEAILAYRIENALTKQQILELYLNQIALGRNAFGVEAASHAYFDKELDELSLPQIAYLAILPKGPANYDPVRNSDRALERRNWVLGEMLQERLHHPGAARRRGREPLGTAPRQPPKFERVGGYFVEEVRRQLIDKFGENADDGPYSVYSGGLWVRTSFDPALQQYAQDALRDGLMRYDGGRGWSGPLGHVDGHADERGAALFANTNIGLDYDDWRAAIVIDERRRTAQLGFADGTTGTLPRGGAQMPVRGVGGTCLPRDRRPATSSRSRRRGRHCALRTVPKVSGGFVVEEPGTGRVLAMQGGFDSRLQASTARRQAQRQPGSTIKPIVYSAALENGMTPASIIVDGPFCVYQGARLGQKCFRNFGNMRAAGPAHDALGHRTVAQPDDGARRRADRHGQGRRHDEAAGGRRATRPTSPSRWARARRRVIKMVNAYAMLANQGEALHADADRLRPGPPRQGDLAARTGAPATAATRPTGTARRCRARAAAGARRSTR